MTTAVRQQKNKRIEAAAAAQVMMKSRKHSRQIEHSQEDQEVTCCTQYGKKMASVFKLILNEEQLERQF